MSNRSVGIMKNHLIKALWSVFLLLPFANMASAGELLLSCPAEVSGSLLQLKTPSPEWQGFVEQRHFLLGAGFMDGEPSGEAHLKPTSTNKVKDSHTVTWKFEREYFNNIWLTCTYAEGAFSLSKKVDGDFTECSVTYKKNERTHNVAMVEKIICK